MCPAAGQSTAGSTVVEVLVQQGGFRVPAGGSLICHDANIVHRATAGVLSRRTLIAEGQLGRGALQLCGNIYRYIGRKGVSTVANLIINGSIQFGRGPDGRPCFPVLGAFQLHGIVAAGGGRFAADIAEGDRAAAAGHIQSRRDEPLILLRLAAPVFGAGSSQRIIRIVVFINCPCGSVVGAFQGPALGERAAC